MSRRQSSHASCRGTYEPSTVDPQRRAASRRDIVPAGGVDQCEIFEAKPRSSRRRRRASGGRQPNGLRQRARASSPPTSTRPDWPTCAAISSLEARPLDVLDYERRRRRLVDETGPIDVLFNCAGIVHGGTVLEATFEDLDFAIDLNVKSMVRTIKAVLPGMLDARRRHDHQHVVGRQQRQRRGQPVRLFDHQGRGDRPDQVGRRRFRGAWHSLQRDLPGHGGFAVAAGAPARAGRLRGRPRRRSSRASRSAASARPNEIADLVVYLATATYTTGHIHIIDGGWTA